MSDKVILPLQAADLIAWQIRRFKCFREEPLRDALKRLHTCRRPPFRHTLGKKDLEMAVRVTLENLTNLAALLGQERVDRFIAGIDKRNQREGVAPYPAH